MDNKSYDKELERYCGELERLNAQIDVWIDEEDYDKVYQTLEIDKDILIEDKKLNLSSLVNALFPVRIYSAHGKDKDIEWEKAFSEKDWTPATRNGNKVIMPIGFVTTNDSGRVDLTTKINASNPQQASVIQAWSRLFYAKLLRTHIKEKGSDCFTRRLDDVLSYLENHLPTSSTDKIIIELKILYLLELSAAAQSYESLGFANRAHRTIREREHQLEDEPFRWFYDLWARYNIGVAYFHEGRYRKAIIEFNYIIWQIKTKENEEKRRKRSVKTELDFFKTRQGYLLLYLPAVIYRADIQLKLQLAYHSLDTLSRYFWGRPTKGSVPYKEIRANLIEAEANQQMEEWENSIGRLREASMQLTNLEGLTEEVWEGDNSRLSLEKLKQFINNNQHQSIKERFLDLLIQDYLNRLKQAEIGKEDALSYANKLRRIFLNTYWALTKYNANNRKGYYQQLAEFLFQLTKIYKEDGTSDFLKMAENLYKENRHGLRQSEKARDNRDNKVECPDCEWQGIGLDRINLEHYKWFTDAMLDFYKNMVEHYESIKPQCSPDEQEMKKYLDDDREEFIKRLIKVEREYREDLRIKDLGLRYRSRVVTDELCSGKDGAKLCLGEQAEIRTNFNKAFANLLECAEKDECKDETLNKHQYKQIMNQWKGRFKRHLECESIHQRHSNGLYFIGLQRWNSASPAQGRSVGGGYLLYHTNKQGTVDLGIAIDPGFDFLRNLFHMGFSLNDIDIILISHAHMDHIRDFESIAVLLDQLKKQVDKKKVIHVILTLGAYERLKHIIEDPAFRYYIEPYIIDVHREIDEYYFEHLPSDEDNFRFVEIEQSTNHGQQPMRYKAIPPSNVSTSASRGNRSKIKVDIKPTRAYHSDPSNYSDSFGFLIEVMLPSGDKATLGYTGDTKWVYPEILDLLKDRHKKIKEISQQYGECDAVVVHLGSLIDDKREFEYYYQCKPTGGEECENLVREKDHPYLVGMLRLLSRLYSLRKSSSDKQLILLGEFGEELRGGIRTDLIKRLKQTYEHRLDFLPIDVGMDVKLWPKQDYKSSESQSKQMVWCVQCGDFVSIEEAKFEPYGVDEALYCVCKTCKKATPLNVLQDRLRQLYEVGRELRTREGE